MRLIPTFGVTAVVTLAGTAFLGSFASALMGPPRFTLHAAPSHAIASPEDLAILSDYCSSHVQIRTQFAVLQPEGTRPVYHQDDHGHVSSIDFLTAGDEIARKVEIMLSASSGRIYNLKVVDLAHDKSHAATTTVEIGYDDYNEKVIFYSIRTAKGVIHAHIQDANEYNDVSVTLRPARRAFMLGGVQSWNGLRLPLAPGPVITII
ncbi:hypothetical protein THASP1DRAFT_33460 [Thamnocephalis sphaerospora]|uniref:Uncharacterized protein n=1 Tax=Thamnocephalis sphaerospora TaxID=78915 RepID=A0A4P9XGJ5_9FUNG|nr:hypothetical protein THASP1DRAFT_33460 [Thamnocephalis sphaerospora]|eukprot:RKP04737.1 hypothetical protein THASP1DRAFT_33460 [Thamnocephalis sphaerospora]